MAPAISASAIRLHKKKFGASLVYFVEQNLGTDLSVLVMIVRTILLFKRVRCFVKKDKTFLKCLGRFVLFVKKIWDGLSVPKGYFVIGTFCPNDRSVAGTFQPGTLRPRTFRPGTFRQGTGASDVN
jgi:hypothetical protein